MDPSITVFPSEQTPTFKDKISQVKTIVKLKDNSIVIGAMYVFHIGVVRLYPVLSMNDMNPLALEIHLKIVNRGIIVILAIKFSSLHCLLRCEIV